MTHGQLPTATCGPTRAVRLALDALHPLGGSLQEITDAANQYRSLSDERVAAILDRLARDGDADLIAPGLWRRAPRRPTAEARRLARAHRHDARRRS